MYLTQDMEPTEQSAAPEQVEMLDKPVAARVETDEDFNVFDKLTDKDEQLNKYYSNQQYSLHSKVAD